MFCKLRFVMVAFVILLVGCDRYFASERRYYDSSSITDENDNGYKTVFNGAYTKEQLTAIYFVETFYRRFNNDDYKSIRLTRDPYFWFSGSQNSFGAGIVRQLLTEGTALLSDGKLKAHFVTSTTPPGTFDYSKVYIEVGFAGSTAEGVASFNSDSNGEVTRGTLMLSTALADPTDDSQIPKIRRVVFHELGHIFGNAVHSGLPLNIMTYNNLYGETNVIPDYELDAWKLYFSIAPHTSLADVKASGVLSNYIPPLIYTTSVEIKDQGLSNQQNPIQAGDTISIFGTNLYYDFGCLGPAEDIVVKIGATTLQHVKPTRSVTCEAEIEAVVPTGIQSGNLIITRDGKESQPFLVYAR